jgi:hypothetical protein
MSRGRNRRPKHPGLGQSKHRKARVQRFKTKNPHSGMVPCMRCGKALKRCTCDGITPDPGERPAHAD